MDSEGAEYEVLEGLLASQIKPDQLLVEFHHRFPGIRPASTVDMVKRLLQTGYMIFRGHASLRVFITQEYGHC